MLPMAAGLEDRKDNSLSHENDSNLFFDVVIIGSGPAGYTASIYTSRAKLKTLIITGSLPGGQLMTTSEVENYPGFPNGIFGPELMINMKQQSERFGTTLVTDEVKKVNFNVRPFEIYTESTIYKAESVLISTGATPRKLGIEPEQTFSGRGISYCATCDGPFFKDQHIVVVGGGDTALEEANFLTKFGKSVKIIHRREHLRASKILQERAFENPKIEFDDKGYVIVRSYTKTNIDGVFASGDVHDYRYRQAITAAGFGCMAALDIEKWLAEKKQE